MKKVRGVLVKLLLISILSTILLTGCSMIEDEESTVQNVFTITFDSDGGRKVQSQFKQENEFVEEPNLTYKIVYNDGEYVLDGWYFGDIKWDFDTMKVKGDMVLKARWNKIENYPKPEI